MQRLSFILLLVSGVFVPGCGLAEGEHLSPVGLESEPLCADANEALRTREAVRSPDFVRLRARVIETFFVDECHQALLLEPLEILGGSLHEPVLAIVPSPRDGSYDRDVGFVGTFDLEPDPELPEIYRTLGG